MSVTNYNPPIGRTITTDTIKYSIDRLDNVVYLVSGDALKDIRIDNGEAYVESVSESPKVIKCYNINFTDDSSFDERYEFAHSLTFSVNGYMNHNDFDGKYYVILKSMDNVYWLANPMFPSKVTYTYTLGASENHTDFTVATKSNFPTLRLNNFAPTDTFECKGYNLCGIESLKLNENKYTAYYGNRIVYTNDGFKEVIYKKNSATFTETFDGSIIQHQLNFDIDFDAYKSSWHYNLLEFTDNRYATVIETACGKYILTGFQHGLQPSFVVNGSGENGDIDRIEITLIDSHDDGLTIAERTEIEYERNSAITYDYTTKYDGYECIGANTAKYLLKEGHDAFGNPNGMYYVLNGYRGDARFSGLNIRGTFNEEVTFTNAECGGYVCSINTSIPTTVTFNEIGCKTYNLKAETDWTISSSLSNITVTPSSGSANTMYQVQICNSQAATSTPVRGSITISYCDKTLSRSVVVEENSTCITSGKRYTVNGSTNVLTIPTICCVKSATESTNTLGIVVNTSSLTVTVPQNTTSGIRTFTIHVTFCDDTVADITITQNNTFERWVDEGRECNGNQMCTKQRLYTGTTSTNVSTPTNTTRFINCVVSDECSSAQYRYIDSTLTTCDNGKKYIVQYEQITYDGNTWRNTGRTRLGDEVEDPNNECSSASTYEYWKVVENDYWCDDITKYQKLRLYLSNVQTDDETQWTATTVYKKGEEVIETESVDCGYIKCSNCWKWDKWEDSDGYFCDGGNKYKRQQRFVSDDNVPNVSQVTNWTATSVYRKGSLIEENSTDCGYDPKWEEYDYSKYQDDGDTICNGYDLYHYLRKYYSKDNVNWEASEIYTIGSLIEFNSFECGYIPKENYVEWRQSGTTCNGYDKYQVMVKWISENGTNWYKTEVTKLGNIVENNSEECGYIEGQYEYQWVLTTLTTCGESDGISSQYRWYTENTYCDGIDNYAHQVKQASLDGGESWQNTDETQEILIELSSRACGAGEYRLLSYGLYRDPLFTYCVGTNPNTVTSGDVKGNEADIVNVTAATIGTCANEIGTNAFMGSSISTIIIPANVTELHNTTFAYCSNLTSVEFKGITPPTIGTGTFSHSDNLTVITVPCGTSDAYKAVANLSSWANLIQEKSECDCVPTATRKTSETAYTATTEAIEIGDYEINTCDMIWWFNTSEDGEGTASLTTSNIVMYPSTDNKYLVTMKLPTSYIPTSGEREYDIWIHYAYREISTEAYKYNLGKIKITKG